MGGELGCRATCDFLMQLRQLAADGNTSLGIALGHYGERAGESIGRLEGNVGDAPGVGRVEGLADRCGTAWKEADEGKAVGGQARSDERGSHSIGTR